MFSQCFGFQIKFAKAQGIEVLVRNFRRPCKIKEVNFNEPLEELFANEQLETKDKKDIANKTIGLCEKKYNSSHVCKIFQNYIEAQHYQLKYSGRIYALQQSIMKSNDKVLDDEQKDDYENMCIADFFAKYPDFDTNVECTEGDRIYVLVIEKKERLVNGYRYIKEIVYNKMAIKMFTLFNIVVSKGIVPKEVKTDAIFL